MATINLAPGAQYVVRQRRRRQTLFGLSLAIGLGLLLAWGSLYVLVRQAVAARTQATAELATLERKIAEAQSQAERVQLFEDRLAAVDVLLATQVTATPILKEIERLLPPPAVLTNLTVDSNRSVVELAGVTPNIDDVAQALASLASSADHPTLFTTANLATISRNERKAEDGVTVVVEYVFKAELSFMPAVLRRGS